MTTQRENGLNIIKVVVQLVLGTILSALAASAAFTAKSLSNHESRLSVVEEWKRDRSEKIDGIARDVAEMRTHNAGVDSQARQTDMLVRDVSAQLRVVSDTLIRMQEGQSAIREKMVSLQVMTDELNKGTK
jgi:septal ring factor EnvC (AmiA/AmiB activator)